MCALQQCLETQSIAAVVMQLASRLCCTGVQKLPKMPWSFRSFYETSETTQETMVIYTSILFWKGSG